MTYQVKNSDQEPILAVDFGTSNSAAALVEGDNVRLLALEDGKAILPSAIFFHDNQEVLVGTQAIRDYIEGEDGRLFRSIKSILGTSLVNESMRLGCRSVSFLDVIEIFMRQIQQVAQRQSDSEIKKIVLGRPVHFHNHKPEADDKAQSELYKVAKSLGFQDIVFQYEPIAAAFAHERHVQKETLACVIDLGGGTSDFTVIRCKPAHDIRADRSDDILATHGVRIGGTNFDTAFSLADFMPHLGMGSRYYSPFEKDKTLDMPKKLYHDLSTWPLVHLGQSPRAIQDVKDIQPTSQDQEALGRLLYLQQNNLGHALLKFVEDTKIELSDRDELAVTWEELELSVHAEQKRFQETTAGLIDGIEAAMNDCLYQAGVKADDIELVIITGGTSYLPAVRALIKRDFAAAQISQDGAFDSVGLGLGYCAKSVFKG